MKRPTSPKCTACGKRKTCTAAAHGVWRARPSGSVRTAASRRSTRKSTRKITLSKSSPTSTKRTRRSSAPSWVPLPSAAPRPLRAAVATQVLRRFVATKRCDARALGGQATIRKRNEHRNALAVTRVLRMEAHEIALLELDRHENVRRRHHREEQMGHGHRRRAPKCEEPSDVQRMTHELVWSGRAELQFRVRLSDQLQPHLTESEEIEVIDEECRHQHESPTERERNPQCDSRRVAVDRPHHAPEGTPLPEQQNQRNAGEEHIRRSLHFLRHDARPRRLEPRSRHHAVLNRK